MAKQDYTAQPVGMIMEGTVPQSKWREITLGECVVINDATYTPKEAWPIINYLDTGNISENRISEIQQLKAGKDNIPSRARRKVQPGDIVYSTVRPNQKHFGLLKSVPENFLASTGFAVLRGRNGLADTGFIYWFLAQNHIVDYLHSIAENSTSAYPSIRPSDLEQLTLSLPPLPEQRAIADVLGTLDDKIELNRRMNETLEEMARALFKSWFVDFDPVHAKAALKQHAASESVAHPATIAAQGAIDYEVPSGWTVGRARAYLDKMDPSIAALFPDRFVDSELGKIPEGWEVRVMGELLIPNNVRLGDSIVPEYSCTNSGLVLRSERFKKKLSASNSKNKVIRKGDFVFGLSRKVLNFGLMRDDVGCVSPAYHTFSVNEDSVIPDLLERIMRIRSEYFYLAVSASSREGQSVSQEALFNLEISLPKIAVQDHLYCILQEFYQRSNHLTKERRVLAQQLNTILPELMSGDITVNSCRRKMSLP